MSIVWEPEADDALRRIIERMNEISHESGVRLARRIRSRVAQLEDFPMSGRVIPEYREIALREVVVAEYRVFYLVRGDDVHVVTLLHGSMDLQDDA